MPRRASTSKPMNAEKSAQGPRRGTLRAFFGDNSLSTLRVLDTLLDKPEEFYSKVELADAAGVSLSTLKVVLDHLLDAGVVVVAREAGKIRFFTINGKHAGVRLLTKLRNLPPGTKPDPPTPP